MAWNDEQTDGQDSNAATAPKDTFERDLTSNIAVEFLKEQRRARRWNTFFKFLAFAYVSVFIVLSIPKASFPVFGDDKVTALVDLQGVISHDSEASADRVVAGLRAAFENDSTAGVILRINSPGGSPVQSGYINDEIFRLRQKYPDVRLYAVIEDLCASGGYYVASAADEIYADKASMIGSIGVRMGGFGFVDSMHKLGVERRLYTAGENKGFLDPFSPLQQTHVDHTHKLLAEVHEQFVNTVNKGRGDRLKKDPELFSGLIWSGERSLELGLIDAFGSSGYVAREVIGAKKIVNFTQHEYSFEKLLMRSGAEFLSKIFPLNLQLQ